MPFQPQVHPNQMTCKQLDTYRLSNYDKADKDFSNHPKSKYARISIPKAVWESYIRKLLLHINSYVMIYPTKQPISTILEI